MPGFSYQAVNATGKRVRGVIEAASQKEATARLAEQQYVVLKVGPQQRLWKKPVKKQVVVDFVYQLAQLLRAGLPVYEALVALEEQYRGEPVQAVLADLCESIRGGMSLSQAMRKHGKLFNGLMCAMVAAGEASGTLPALLDRLSALMTRQEKTRKGLLTALIYPALLAGFCAVVVTALLAFAIPSLEVLLEGRSVNGWTQMIFGMSHLVTESWMWLLMAMGAGIGVLGWWLRRPESRLQLKRLVVRLPLMKTLLMRAALSRFTRTLGTLLEGGVPLAQALPLAREVLSHPVLEPIVAQVETRITEGKSFGAELARAPEMPRLLSRLVAVGEESGELAQMLHHCGTLYEAELEKSLARVSALAQPAVLILMGGIVAAIMVGVLLPLTDLSGIGGM
jgi:general secretion pathway protein F/type IV pilus assembly protein PilC